MYSVYLFESTGLGQVWGKVISVWCGLWGEAAVGWWCPGWSACCWLPLCRCLKMHTLSLFSCQVQYSHNLFCLTLDTACEHLPNQSHPLSFCIQRSLLSPFSTYQVANSTILMFVDVFPGEPIWQNLVTCTADVFRKDLKNGPLRWWVGWKP